MGASGPGLYALDLRPLLDDDATTGAAQVVALGYVPSTTTPAAATTGVAQVVVRGSWAYLATDQGLETVDVSAALDADAATVLSAATPTGRLRAPGSYTHTHGVAVYGGYAFMAPLTPSGQIFSVDVAQPLAPVYASGVDFVRQTWDCSVNGTAYTQRAGVSVVGSRLFVTSAFGSRVYDLE